MKKWIGILLIGIMFLSSIAFAVVQSLFSGQPPQQEQTNQNQAGLPSQLIIDYRMSPAQFQEAISRGFTVATYKYDKNCIACVDERGFIEQLVLSKDFQNQIILEEIEKNGESELEVASFFGKKKLENIDANSTIKVFCELVANPPLGCVVS